MALSLLGFGAPGYVLRDCWDVPRGNGILDGGSVEDIV